MSSVDTFIKKHALILLLSYMCPLAAFCGPNTMSSVDTFIKKHALILLLITCPLAAFGGPN